MQHLPQFYISSLSSFCLPLPPGDQTISGCCFNSLTLQLNPSPLTDMPHLWSTPSFLMLGNSVFTTQIIVPWLSFHVQILLTYVGLWTTVLLCNAFLFTYKLPVLPFIINYALRITPLLFPTNLFFMSLIYHFFITDSLLHSSCVSLLYVWSCIFCYSLSFHSSPISFLSLSPFSFTHMTISETPLIPSFFHPANNTHFKQNIINLHKKK